MLADRCGSVTPSRAALALSLVGSLALMLLATPALAADADKVAAKAHYEAATRLYDIPL